MRLMFLFFQPVGTSSDCQNFSSVRGSDLRSLLAGALRPMGGSCWAPWTCAISGSLDGLEPALCLQWADLPFTHSLPVFSGAWVVQPEPLLVNAEAKWSLSTSAFPLSCMWLLSFKVFLFLCYFKYVTHEHAMTGRFGQISRWKQPFSVAVIRSTTSPGGTFPASLLSSMAAFSSLLQK